MFITCQHSSFPPDKNDAKRWSEEKVGQLHQWKVKEKGREVNRLKHWQQRLRQERYDIPGPSKGRMRNRKKGKEEKDT